MEKMNRDNEELCQLRKTNSNLEDRIHVLIRENELRTTTLGSDREIEGLRAEVSELKETIEQQKINLDVAKTRELRLIEVEQKVSRLVTEKKELSARLAAKTHSIESLSQRNNAQRDELRAAEDTVAELDRKLKNIENNNEMLRNDRQKLEEQLISLRLQTEEALSRKGAEVEQANSRLSLMLKNEGDKNHKLALLDTDLIIAKKDLEATRKALFELQERPVVDSARVTELESQLEEVRIQLIEAQKNMDLAEQEAREHKRMLSKAMDTVAKLEKCSNIAEHNRERSRLLKEIEVLTEKVGMENEYASKGGKEKQKLLSDIENLSKQLGIEQTRSQDKDNYIQKAKEEMELCMKAKDNLQEELRRMKKHKQIGLEYITELKATITELRTECDKMKELLMRNKSDTEARVTQLEQCLKNKTKEANSLQKELNHMRNQILKDGIENSGVRHNSVVGNVGIPFSQLKANQNNAISGSEDITKKSFSCHHPQESIEKENSHEKPECKHQ